MFGQSRRNSSSGRSSSSSMSSAAAASRRNSLSLLEKPSEAMTGFTSFASLPGLGSLKSLSPSRVPMLPMPVVSTAATSVWSTAKTSLSSIRLPSVRYTSLAFFFSSNSPAASQRLRLLVSHCLYRRLLVWVAAIFTSVLILILVHSSKHGAVFGFGKKQIIQEAGMPKAEGIWLNYTRLDGYYNGVRTIVPVGEYKPEYPTVDDQVLAWEQERGSNANNQTNTADASAKADVDVNANGQELGEIATRSSNGAGNTTEPQSAPMPTPKLFKPQPDYNSSAYRAQYYPVQRCYLDESDKVPVPDLWAFQGVPQGQPKPLFGSHELLGLRSDVCFDRFGRYGPYGFGYSKEEGGTGEGLDTESNGGEIVWSSTSGKINYSNVNWASAQARCLERNKGRFVETERNNLGFGEFPRFADELRRAKERTDATAVATMRAASNSSSKRTSGLVKLERTAVVIRCYAGFKWTPHVVLNMRALVSELSLQSGGEYDVHILLHARDEAVPIWADAQTAKEFISNNIPAEFRGLTTLWSEGQMRLLYPGLRDRPTFSNPCNGDIHGVYRSAHLPLQQFAQQFPEYAHYWNWEMDMRFVGSYYELFDRLGKWAAAQSRRRIWDRAAKYYIPALHGSWENFTARVDAEAHEAGRPSILGPLFFAGRSQTRAEENGVSPLPSQQCEGAVLSTYSRTAADHSSSSAATSSSGRFFADRNNNYTEIPEACGVGEDADLITLNPMFDSEDSGWMFADDVTGYDKAFAIPPRRTAIITASRLSRRLLFAMHEETWRLRHSMFAEMFPPSVALHRGFKATYAPHPVYADRKWPLAAAERAFNTGPDHSSGASRQSPFDPENEHYHRGMSWYYNADFAGRLWRRWLGFPQPRDDPKAPKPANVDQTAGGLGDEQQPGSTGRMCMRSMLVHPIKFDSISEILPS